jgi:hypothetical protein
LSLEKLDDFIPLGDPGETACTLEIMLLELVHGLGTYPAQKITVHEVFTRALVFIRFLHGCPRI